MSRREPWVVRLHGWLLRRCSDSLGSQALRDAGADFAELYRDAAARGARARAGLLWSELRSLLATVRHERRYLGREPWETRPDAAARSVLPVKWPLRRRLRAVGELLWRSFRIGARQLLREPGFTAVTALFLGFGILIATAGFAFLNAAFLRPAPYVEAPEQLVRIYTSDFRSNPYGPSAYLDMLDLRDGVDGLVGVLGYSGGQVIVSVGGEEPRPAAGQRVTGRYFEILGVPLLVGRGITDEEVEAGSLVVVVGYEFWQRRLGGLDNPLGAVIEINGKKHTVVGVAPPGMLALGEPLILDLWVPLLKSHVDRRGTAGMAIVGRMAPGTTTEQLDQQLDAVAGYLADTYPDLWVDSFGNAEHFTAASLQATVVAPDARTEMMLVIALGAILVGVLVATVCANVATLFLVRALRQRGAIATRLALGAGRGRIVVELVVQGVLLAAIGASIGLALTHGLARMLASGNRAWLEMPVAVDIGVDYRVVGFAVLMVVVAAAAFALIPALRVSDLDLAAAMKGGNVAGHVRRWNLRRGLVAVQVAGSLTLLVGAAIVIQGLGRLQATDIGFDPNNVVIAEVDLSYRDYDREQQRAFAEAVTSVPGLSGIVAARTVPLRGVTYQSTLTVDDFEAQPGQVLVVPINFVSPRYFEVMRMPLVAGRPFDSGDRAGAPLTVIVNEAFVRAFDLPDNPVGHGVVIDDERTEVVGVVADAKYQSPAEPHLPHMWQPLAQVPGQRLVLHYRGGSDAAASIATLRDAIHAVDPELALVATERLEQVVNDATLGERVLSAGLGGAGLLALGLAVLGIYGSVSHLVGQRAHEIGVRIAVGATSRSVVALVLREGLWLIAFGLAVGAAASVAVGQALRSAIPGLGEFEPVTLIVGVALLGAVALLSSLGPALRAAGLDPARTLRAE